MRAAKLQAGERALVMGAGPIGLMTLLWLKREGVAHVTVSDFAAPRRALAEKLGADLVLNPAEDNVVERLTAMHGGLPQVVFECVGVAGTIQQAIDNVALHGRVIVVGVCMTEDQFFPRTGINKQATLQFVLAYTIEEYAETLAAIAAGVVDPSPLVTRITDLDGLPAAFKALSDPRECKVVYQA